MEDNQEEVIEYQEDYPYQSGSEEDLFKNETTIDKLIEPDLKNIDNINSLISRDTILGNFDEDDIYNLENYSGLVEYALLNRERYLTYTSFVNSILRRAKVSSLITRGKKGFQNKLLKTNISVVGKEQMEI